MPALTYGSIIFEARFSEDKCYKVSENYILFHTEYVISSITKGCVFTCRYWQYYARESRAMVVNFFISVRKMPLFYISDGLDTFCILLKGSAHQFGSVRRGQEIKPVSGH